MINSQHYSFENKTLKNVKIFKFDLDNKFLERIDVTNVIMENDELWRLEDGFRLKINKKPGLLKNLFKN